jgi:hypothetical protein
MLPIASSAERHALSARAARAAAALLVIAGAACARTGSADVGPAAAPTAAAAPSTAAAAATPATPASAGTQPTLAILNAAFYGKSANSIEPGDSATAEVATTRIWQVIRESGALTLADSARVATLGTQYALAGRSCSTSIDCARRVGGATGARWVLMAKVSKTSNLIWYFSGQVIDVATGKILMDDEFELKGIRDEMIPLGARSLARRAVKVTQRAMTTAASGAQ